MEYATIVLSNTNWIACLPTFLSDIAALLPKILACNYNFNGNFPHAVLGLLLALSSSPIYNQIILGENVISYLQHVLITKRSYSPHLGPLLSRLITLHDPSYPAEKITDADLMGAFLHQNGAHCSFYLRALARGGAAKAILKYFADTGVHYYFF